MFRYLKLAAVGLSLMFMGPLLAGCNELPTLDIQSKVTLNTEAGILAGYGLLLNAEQSYKDLPLCKTGTTPSVINICAKRSVIVRLQASDKIANTTLNKLVSFTKTYPNINPSQYISAARSAILSAQDILNSGRS